MVDFKKGITCDQKRKYAIISYAKSALRERERGRERERERERDRVREGGGWRNLWLKVSSIYLSAASPSIYPSIFL